MVLLIFHLVRPMSSLNNSVHVVVTKEVAVHNQAKWLEIAFELTEATRKEAGCIRTHL